jgi:VanZ family protein
MRPAMSALIRFATAPEQRRLWRLLLAILLAAITWLALAPHPPRTASTGWDKANHLLAFAALAFASVWALWPRPRQWGLLAAALLAYGGAIELAQSFVPPRSADWIDLVADGLGIAAGLLAALPFTRGAARRR